MIDIREIDFGTPEYDECIRLRYKILKVPLGIEFSLEELENEWKQIHLAAYNSFNRLLACLVLEPKNGLDIKMKQVAVDKEFQKKGIGTKLVKVSEIISKENGYDQIILNARDTAIPFYLKLQYKKIGEEFEEVGIPHYKMFKKL